MPAPAVSTQASRGGTKPVPIPSDARPNNVMEAARAKVTIHSSPELVLKMKKSPKPTPAASPPAIPD